MALIELGRDKVLRIGCLIRLCKKVYDGSDKANMMKRTN